MYRALIAAVFAGLPLVAWAEAPRPVVVELFTSQGCSSCPPADRLLRGLAQGRADVLPLAFHVTYWNRLGWVDPYSFDGATERQRGYERLSSIGGIYTPQAVVDGVQDVVGSDAPGLERAIRAAAARPVVVAVSAVRDAGGVAVSLGDGAGAGRVLVVGYDPEHVTKVGRGENAGETLVEANIVRGLMVAGEWRGVSARLHVTAPVGAALAVLVQGRDGRILGAARVAGAGS